MKVKSIFSNYIKWRSYRRTRTELSQLSDRELNDLGVSRYDITTIAKRSVGF